MNQVRLTYRYKAIIYYAPTSKPLTLLVVQSVHSFHFYSFWSIGPEPEYDLSIGYWGVRNSERELPPIPAYFLFVNSIPSQTLSTLPAIVLLDSVGRRPLLMFGAAGCCISLVIVGSLVAAFGNDWQGHVTAGHVAIGTPHLKM